ncbi:hypothetical protein BB560_001733 [Smittium megazygosporum]|uniref:Uncharacterized protein n=1 Tax=Smittium megazygosporum TaxID=133381 RepID=A0A2T9ZGX9_9FUNG|nr:hypothetical protein BB560_001733 [Smittium megazygosporum]
MHENIQRCFGLRMGDSDRQYYSLREMEVLGEIPSYQRKKAFGNTKSNKTTNGLWKSSQSLHRQQYNILYVKKSGGTRSKVLLAISEEIWKHCICTGTRIIMDYVSTYINPANESSRLLEFDSKNLPKTPRRKGNNGFSSTLLENQYLVPRSTKASASKTINDSGNGNNIRSHELQVTADKEQGTLTRSMALKRARYEEEDITEDTIDIILNSEQTRKRYKKYGAVQTRYLSDATKITSTSEFFIIRHHQFFNLAEAKRRVESRNNQISEEDFESSRPIYYFVHKLLHENENIGPDDPRIIFAATMRAILSEAATMLTQGRVDNLQYGLNLQGKPARALSTAPAASSNTPVALSGQLYCDGATCYPGQYPCGTYTAIHKRTSPPPRTNAVPILYPSRKGFSERTISWKREREGWNVKPPVGSRLQLFKKTWEKLTDNLWVKETIANGYKLPFVSQSPLTRHPNKKI